MLGSSYLVVSGAAGVRPRRREFNVGVGDPVKEPEGNVNALDLLDVVCVCKRPWKEGLALVMRLQGGKRLLLGKAERNDVIRLEYARKLSGNDGRVIAVGAARGGSGRVADKLSSAARAVIGAKVLRVLAPLVFKLRGVPPVAVRLSVRVGLGGLRLLLAHQPLYLFNGVVSSAVIAFEHSGSACKVQRSRAGRAFIVCYL